MRPTSVFFPLTYFAAPRWLSRAATPLIDAGAWTVALTGAEWLRYDFDFGQVDGAGLARVTSVAVAVVWIAGIVTHLYLGRYAVGSLDETLTLARVTGIVCLAVLGLDFVCVVPPVPYSVPLIAAFLAPVMSVAVRLVIRCRRAHKARPDPRSARRVIIYGAGTRGRELVRAMLSGAVGDTLPVALLDDDPALRHNRISGVPVRGTWRELAAVARQTGAEQLIVAFPNPAPAKIRAVSALARDARLDVKTVPPLSEQLRPWTRISDLRELDVAGLLGRPLVAADVEASAGWLRGKRVLVTGAGGSVGSELCRRIDRLGLAELFMLDRDESALHAARLSIHPGSGLGSPGVILGDVRDTEGMRALFRDLRPDVVFHAAGLKHLPLLERYPDEAWKTNVLGTLCVLEAAREAGVRRFVNISTNKAVNPTSMLGRSERIAERLVADAAQRADGVFVSVRFGNVLGSRGSVLTTFTEQLAAGGPLTVTHSDVTRFLTTAVEAARLVIQAAAIGSSGDALVLDTGSPARVTALAELLITMSGSDSRIVFTGLGRGEKLHDELFGPGERDHRPVHPAIAHVQVPPLAPGTVLARGARLGSAAAMAELVESPRIIAPRTGGPAGRAGVAPAASAGREAERR